MPDLLWTYASGLATLIALFAGVAVTYRNHGSLSGVPISGLATLSLGVIAFLVVTQWKRCYAMRA